MKSKLEEFFKSVQKEGHEHPGWVYFIYNTRKPSKVKIGFSINIKKRLSQIQVGSSEPLELLGGVQANKASEKWLHELLRSWKIRGEWYECNEESREFIIESTKLHHNVLISQNKREQDSIGGGIDSRDVTTKLEDDYIRQALSHLFPKDIPQATTPPFNWETYTKAVESAKRVEANLLNSIKK